MFLPCIQLIQPINLSDNLDNDFAEAMESISCGTPMLAANAQGFAMYLTHGVNATQMQRALFGI